MLHNLMEKNGDDVEVVLAVLDGLIETCQNDDEVSHSLDYQGYEVSHFGILIDSNEGLLYHLKVMAGNIRIQLLLRKFNHIEFTKQEVKVNQNGKRAKFVVPGTTRAGVKASFGRPTTYIND